MSSIFKQDLYRYYGDKGASLKERLLRPREISYIHALRMCQESSSLLSKIYWRLRLRKLSRETQIQIPHATKIGGYVHWTLRESYY